jgi:phosphopantetheinyl transferase
MSFFFEKKIRPDSLIAVWQITEKVEEFLKLLPPLQKEEQSFLARITFPARKLEWLASRVLIYQYTGFYPASGYKDTGQPFLTACNDKISISHTKGYAAIALSKKKMPGIDIEYPSTRIEKVMDRFLHPEEHKFLSTSNLRNRQLGLIWCLKEAVFKQTGIPGLSFKDQIVTQPFMPLSDKGEIAAKIILPGRTQKTIKLEYHIHQDFYLAWTI